LGYFQGAIIKELLRHLEIVAISIPVSIMVSVPLGFYISPRPRLAQIVIYITSILMTIPSLALFGIMVILLAPFHLGLGMTPAIIAIALYSLLPITRNTYIALNQVSEGMIEAGKGMGFTRSQILWKIKMPIAIPVILGGIRSAATIIIGTAVVASIIGGGGLGDLIFIGLKLNRPEALFAGAFSSALMAIIVDRILAQIEKVITPKGLKIKR